MSAASPGAAESPWGTRAGYAQAFGLAAIVTLGGIGLFASGSIANIGLLYLIPVMFAATRHGLRTGVVTGLACSLAYNFFFIPPIHTFSIANPQNILTVLTLLGVAAVASHLAARSREQAINARASAAEAAVLAGFARLLTGVRTVEQLGQVVCAEVGRILGARAVLLLPGESGLAPVAAAPAMDWRDPLDRTAAGWAYDNNRAAGRGSATLPSCEWLFQPVTADGEALAVLGVARGDAGVPVQPEQRPMLASLLDQTGLALQRIELEARLAELAQIAERDRLRQALLSSVSHDLRTPLTAIRAALDELAVAIPGHDDLLVLMRDEVERLHRFVANLLDMARIEAGSLRRTIEPVDLAEAVAAAAHDLRTSLSAHALRSEIGADLPFVRVDPHLFHHCLINVLENAARYSDPGSPITVAARRAGQGLVLEILDEGAGIPPGEERRVFDTFARIEGSDRRGGTGLGLAIVKGFAEAMDIAVSIANRADRRGTAFSFRFGPAQCAAVDLPAAEARE